MRHRRDYSVAFPAFCALFLAACSSSGGGMGAAAPSGAASASAPVATTVVTSGVPVNLQSANTMVTYQAASATDTVSALSTNGLGGAAAVKTPGQGATLTITTDASGNLKALSFNMPGFTGGFPGSGFASLTPSATIDATNVADILTANYGSSNSIGYTLSQVTGGQLLSSSAYGAWLSTDSGKVAHLGAFAIGNLTPASAVPATGSATFNGATTGANSVVKTDSVYAVQGNVQIVANFSAQTVTASLTNFVVRTAPYSSAPAVSGLPNLTGTAPIAGNGYAGTISGGMLSGTINGNFYGSGAQETAGVWQASGGGNTWMGSYGAR